MFTIYFEGNKDILKGIDKVLSYGTQIDFIWLKIDNICLPPGNDNFGFINIELLRLLKVCVWSSCTCELLRVPITDYCVFVRRFPNMFYQM